MGHNGSEQARLVPGCSLRCFLLRTQRGVQFYSESEEEPGKCGALTRRPPSRDASNVTPSASASICSLEIAAYFQHHSVIAPHWQVKVKTRSAVVRFPDVSKPLRNVTERDTTLCVTASICHVPSSR